MAVSKQNVDRSEILEKDGANKVASDFTDFKGALAGSQVAVVNAQNSLNNLCCHRSSYRLSGLILMQVQQCPT